MPKEFFLSTFFKLPHLSTVVFSLLKLSSLVHESHSASLSVHWRFSVMSHSGTLMWGRRRVRFVFLFGTTKKVLSSKDQLVKV